VTQQRSSGAYCMKEGDKHFFVAFKSRFELLGLVVANTWQYLLLIEAYPSLRSTCMFSFLLLTTFYQMMRVCRGALRVPRMNSRSFSAGLAPFNEVGLLFAFLFLLFQPSSTPMQVLATAMAEKAPTFESIQESWREYPGVSGEVICCSLHCLFGALGCAAIATVEQFSRRNAKSETKKNTFSVGCCCCC
jgi:hypothetical protein